MPGKHDGWEGANSAMAIRRIPPTHAHTHTHKDRIRVIIGCIMPLRGCNPPAAVDIRNGTRPGGRRGLHSPAEPLTRPEKGDPWRVSCGQWQTGRRDGGEPVSRLLGGTPRFLFRPSRFFLRDRCEKIDLI